MLCPNAPTHPSKMLNPKFTYEYLPEMNEPNYVYYLHQEGYDNPILGATEAQLNDGQFGMERLLTMMQPWHQ